jgi:hypothetical protein
LTDLRQRESAFEASRTMTMERVLRQLPTFNKATQNVLAGAVLLDTLPAPSTNRVSKMYQWLKIILGTAATQQTESSLQHRVKASILLPTRPKDKGQRATQGTLDAGSREFPATSGQGLCFPMSACETHAVGAAMIVKDVASIMRGLAHRRLEASCMTLVS